MTNILGITLIVITLVAVQTALSLVFDHAGAIFRSPL